MLKSPTELAVKLAKHWYNNGIRQKRLLCADEWPLEIPIGKPSATEIAEQPARIRQHLANWRAINVGQVQWQNEKYRGTSAAIALPRYWQLNNPSEWIAACGDNDIKKEFCHFESIVKNTDAIFHPLIIRQRSHVVARPAEEVIQAANVAMALQPGYAKGKPLRLLSINGCDSKFFERNRHLIIHMLMLRFGNAVNEIGLEGFLDALDERDHWLLVVPLEKNLLPFNQQRVRAKELMESSLPGSHVLIVENEHCVYQLPPLPGVIAVLGAGLNLGWLASEHFHNKVLGYWGDIDTWGLKMLAKARVLRPDIIPLMMDCDTFDRFEGDCAVVEPVVADSKPAAGLTKAEARLYAQLQNKDRGRLEQEFIAAELVNEIVTLWRTR